MLIGLPPLICAGLMLSPCWADGEGKPLAGRAGYALTASDVSGKAVVSLSNHPSGKALIELPEGMGKKTVDELVRSALWSEDGGAVIMFVNGKNGVYMVGFVRVADGAMKNFDISAVESANFGKLGMDRKKFSRWETKPTGWSIPEAGIFRLMVVTTAWDQEGKRYTMREPMIIRKDGSPLWR